MAFGSNPTGYSNLAIGSQAITGTAAQMPASPASKIQLSAPKGNTNPVVVGTAGTVTTTTGFSIAPGQVVELDIANLNMLYAIGTGTGDFLDYAVVY